MDPIDRLALFRLAVLGPLISRDHLARGELQHLIRELAQRPYDIGACQGSCRLNYALLRFSFNGPRAAWASLSCSGLRVTTLIGSQLRVCCDQRRG